jgi:hypothetical protein
MGKIEATPWSCDKVARQHGAWGGRAGFNWGGIRKGLSMSDNAVLRDLFDRWERVWHEGQCDLIPICVGQTYIRHDEKGDRTVTREDYAAEIEKTRQERPNTRFVVYDHTFEDNRAWYRFTLKWTDPNSGETRTRAGMQVYRIEAGKLSETWLMLLQSGSAWIDAVAQEHWTGPSPIK